jgi:putative pyruvate formate lyase activating enzyme
MTRGSRPPTRHPAAAPAYLRLGLSALRARARKALAGLAECRACPRDCGVDRLHDKWSACKTGRFAQVSSYFPHFGEEDCLRGWRGSGTVFFAHCNLRCVFCQNFDISQALKPGMSTQGTPPDRLAGMMLELQDLGCHNINLVTPEHVVPQVLEALSEAAAAGLSLPIVYNTSGYDALESLKLMDGVVDIYMPDFKLWSAERSRVYLRAKDYPEAARAAIVEMHRQVGPLLCGDDGVAVRGLLIRHLVMPGCLDETRAILEWIAEELGQSTYVNLMGQYRPGGRVRGGRYAELDTPLDTREFSAAIGFANSLGLRLDRRMPNRMLRRRNRWM